MTYLMKNARMNPRPLGGQHKLILHIPHASTRIPLLEGYLLDEAALKEEQLKLTDWYTDDLFTSETDAVVRADFSRIFCDPERFVDDAQEVMAKWGMGVLYEKTDEGKALRTISPALREQILNGFYRPHHTRFSDAVNRQLAQHGKALILDCHSFPDAPLKRDLDQRSERPDFNIGTDAFHTPEELIDYSVAFFKDAGYSLGVDWPYAGAIVPMEHYHKNADVHSIMLEINRALYLKEPGNEKSEQYEQIKAVTQAYVQGLKAVFFRA